MNYRRMLAAVGVAALVFATAAACPPEAGDKCDPKKELQYYSQHTENGKTVTVNLECKEVGYKKYKWVKAT
jgi:hypothetical protein